MRHLLIVVFFICLEVCSAQQPVFVSREENSPISPLYLTLEDPDTTLLWDSNTTFDFVSNQHQFVQIRTNNCEPLYLPLSKLLAQDTIRIKCHVQLIEEVTVSESAIRRESHDTMHVIDFQFVNGQLITLQKSVHDIRAKFIGCGGFSIPVDNHTTLLHQRLDNGALIRTLDSVYLFTGSRLEFLETYEAYSHKFNHFIGQHGQTYYFKDPFFYHLIDAYSYYNVSTQEQRWNYISYDSSSFYFISQQFKTVPRTPSDIYFAYSMGPHSGLIFRNREKIQFSKPTIHSLPVYRMLSGSPGFLNVLSILEPSRSEAYLLDSICCIIDFNRNRLCRYMQDSLLAAISISSLSSFWYKSEFTVDAQTGKGYFLVREGMERLFVEINLYDGSTRRIHLPGFFNQVVHWEVSNGRLYFLVSDDKQTDWQRTFYSCVVGDPRLN